MAESGFGSTSYTPAPTLKDAGFGSPSDFALGSAINEGRDTGFGSPFDPSLLPLSVEGDTYLIGDDGGVRLDISGQWFAFSNIPAPGYADSFVVKFKNRGTSVLYDALAGYSSDKPGNGQVYTNLQQTRIYAYIPPLPHGVYDVEVRWDGNTARISEAFEVTLRNRAAEVYSLRTHLPAYMKTGEVSPENDLLDVTPTYGLLEGLTRSVGMLIQRYAGRPLTLVTQQWDEGDSVINIGSTVGFPDSGSLIIDGVKMSYLNKSNTSFTGVTHLRGAFKPSFKLGERVVPYVDPRK
jgi:hypothetical protein